jgi:hypothetical protein
MCSTFALLMTVVSKYWRSRMDAVALAIGSGGATLEQNLGRAYLPAHSTLLTPTMPGAFAA